MFKSQGFSLLEIIVAVAITAIISVLAFQQLSTAVGTQESVKQSDDALAQLQRAINRISTDLQQVAARSVRNEYGDKVPALMGDKNGAESFLSFTRQGKRNPANLPRTELERVTYRLEEDKLVREQWATLDIALEEQKLPLTLMEDVLKFEVEFYADEEWMESWPIEDYMGAPQEQLSNNFPRAVKVTIETATLGQLIQIYPLGIGS
ncbi:type II secretion system minor pseudopilin GspJ [Pleionea sediminis]|uniref:type II secretion system minor pseudopilin GspJ n=1 Tax=Pleionea sediminis TaxID=2569479 RepID=UPI0013DE24F6|nr:type II secretion system minor pseudopilin GspJ [Pleionea sediminis]